MGACLKSAAQAGEPVVLSAKDSRAASSQAGSTSTSERPDSSQNLSSGTQVLSDKALRKLIRGSLFRSSKRRDGDPSNIDDSQGSTGRRRKLTPEGSLRFGCDTVAAAEERPGLECGICFGPRGDNPAKRWCGNSKCKDAFCSTCLGRYVTGKVQDALHFAPPVLCPSAACRWRIPTAVWSPAVEPIVRERYTSNASALLAIRCPRCDEVKSLLRAPDLANSHESEQHLASLTGSSLEAMRQDWHSFAIGQASGDELLSLMLKGAGSRVGPEGTPPTCVRRTLDMAASMVQDEERRVCIQLAAFRRFPKLRTPCCNAKMCFKCKVAGWHPRISCEARQQKFVESGSGVQCCPSCGIPTQRTEGCLQMDCVCGKSWTWQHTQEELRELEQTFTPLPLVCLGIPGAVDVDFFRSLLEHRADLTLVRQSDRWTAAHFAAVARSDMEGVHLPGSDASRLQVLLQLQDTGSPPLDLDAADVDGDTPLSVAVAGGNVAAAKVLVARGAKFRRTVWESLESHTPAPDRLEMRQHLRPLLERPGSKEEDVEGLPLWLEFGLEDKAVAALAEFEPGETCEESVANAFAWGSWRGGGSGASSSSSSGASSTSVVSKALEEAFGEAEWSSAKTGAATRMLWRVLESGWPHRAVDMDALNAALTMGARIWRLDGDDDEAHPLGEALERQEAEAVRALLACGPSPPPLLEDSTEDSPLGPSFVRALELLSPARSVPITRALAPQVDAAAQAYGKRVPLWLSLQLGLTTRSQQLLEEGAAVGADEAAGAIKRALFNQYEGVANPFAPVELIRSRVTEERWAELRQGAATALLHLELHQAHNFERDPDLDLCRKLLGDFGADPSALSGSLAPEFSELAKVSSNGENLSPLMLLAANCYVSAGVAKQAAQLLIEFKADPNQPDEDGDTALFWALLQQQAHVAEVLVRAGGRMADACVDRLQAWSHPGHLQPLAAALAPQLQKLPSSGQCEEEEWPAWMQVQFGLARAKQAAEAADTDEGLLEVFEALLLAPCCGGSPGAIEASLKERLGEEPFARHRTEAAGALLGREVVGAFGGKWPLDTAWVKKLLDYGADVNMLLDLGDSAEPEEDFGDIEDSFQNSDDASRSEEDGSDEDRQDS